MNERIFKISIIVVASVFTLVFCVVVLPPLFENPDIPGAFGAGFVNPYASGYSADVISCWVILALWVWFETKSLSIKHGWVCLLLGVFPGVAVGFAAYLLLRQNQLSGIGEPSDT